MHFSNINFKLVVEVINTRLSQNRVEMASFVLFQIEVIWIFFKKEAYKLTFSIQTVFYWYKPLKRLFLQDYVQWPAGRTQFQPS